MLYSDIKPSYYEKMGYKKKDMELGYFEAKEHGLKLKELSYDSYKSLKRNRSTEISKDDSRINWLSKRYPDLKVLISEDTNEWLITGEHESEAFILEYSNFDEKLFEQACLNLEKDKLGFWHHSNFKTSKKFEQEIPMFKSELTDISDIIDNIQLFPIDHV